MKNLLLIILTLIPFILKAQVYEGKTYIGEPSDENKKKWNKEIAEQIKETITIVAIDGADSETSEAFMTAMEIHWKLTPFKFVKIGEIDKYIGDPKYSIIAPFYTAFSKESKEVLSYNVGFALCKTKYKEFQKIEWQTTYLLPAKYADRNLQLRDYKHLVSFIVRKFSRVITNWDKSSLERTSTYDPVALVGMNSYANSGRDEIISKTILLCSDDLGKDFDRAYFKKNIIKNLKNRNQSVRVVSAEEIMNAVDSKDPNVVIFDTFRDGESLVTKGGYGNLYAADNLEYLGTISSFSKGKVKVLQIVLLILVTVGTVAYFAL